MSGIMYFHNLVVLQVRHKSYGKKSMGPYCMINHVKRIQSSCPLFDKCEVRRKEVIVQVVAMAQ